ncbi:MAG: hypothetical protein ACRC6V_01955 [Bacteroidales bacterium]
MLHLISRLVLVASFISGTALSSRKTSLCAAVIQAESIALRTIRTSSDSFNLPSDVIFFASLSLLAFFS